MRRPVRIPEAEPCYTAASLLRNTGLRTLVKGWILAKKKFMMPPEQFVRAQLERILASASFAHSERSRRLLRFLVEQSLQGSSDALKESVIAVEVFRRRPSFDPQTDSIVRVEAHRLREKLNAYYEEEGQYDRISVELVKGSYVPIFRERSRPIRLWRAWFRVRSATSWKIIAGAGLAALAAGAVIWWLTGRTEQVFRNPPSILVLPLADLSPNKDQGYVCEAVTEEVIQALAKFEDLRVVSRPSPLHHNGGKEDNAALLLGGTVRKRDDTIRIIVRLVNAQNGSALWAQTYELESQEAQDNPEEAARVIANELRVWLTASPAHNLGER